METVHSNWFLTNSISSYLRKENKFFTEYLYDDDDSGDSVSNYDALLLSVKCVAGLLTLLFVCGL